MEGKPVDLAIETFDRWSWQLGPLVAVCICLVIVAIVGFYLLMRRDEKRRQEDRADHKENLGKICATFKEGVEAMKSDGERRDAVVNRRLDRQDERIDALTEALPGVCRMPRGI